MSYFQALLNNDSSTLSQSADSSSETVQLQCTTLSEQQAGAAGPNSKVPHTSLPLHREHTAPSQPGLESPKRPVRIQSTITLPMTLIFALFHRFCLFLNRSRTLKTSQAVNNSTLRWGNKCAICCIMLELQGWLFCIRLGIPDMKYLNR